MRVIVACLALICTQAAASDLTFTPEATETCLKGAATEGARLDCIGASAEACYSPDEVYSNYAFGACLSMEADYWDGRLNAAYRGLLAAETALGAEMAEIGATVPDAEAALRDMQRAWIPYRDAACWYEYTTWGGGTGGGPGHSGCLMRLTGMQALELEARVKERGE